MYLGIDRLGREGRDWGVYGVGTKGINCILNQ